MTEEKRDRTPGFPDAPKKQVVLPDLGAATADTHAHLDMLDDPAGALRRAGEAGVAYVATVVDLTEQPERTLGELDTWRAEAGSGAPQVGIILGLHPHNAKHWGPEIEMQLRTIIANDSRIVGLGELGLDFHYDHSPRDDQRAMFRRQLELAHEFGLPVTIHLREAHAEGLEILREVGVPLAGAIVHCFTEDIPTAEEFLALGESVFISFAGPLTFNKGVAIREAATVVPLDRLLAETDCPFLAPAPYRGMPNEPAYVKLNVAKLAEVRQQPTAEIAAAVLTNAGMLFGKE